MHKGLFYTFGPFFWMFFSMVFLHVFPMIYAWFYSFRLILRPVVTWCSMLI